MTEDTRPIVEGGPGSGHHGHKGVPGKRGGSAPGGSGGGYPTVTEGLHSGDKDILASVRTFFGSRASSADALSLRGDSTCAGAAYHLANHLTKEFGSGKLQINGGEFDGQAHYWVQWGARGRSYRLDVGNNIWAADNNQPIPLIVASTKSAFGSRYRADEYYGSPSAFRKAMKGNTWAEPSFDAYRKGVSELAFTEQDDRPIPPTELPVWIWLPDLQRYRDLTTGRFASEPEVMEWVATSIRGSSVVTDTLTQQLAQRQLRLGAWQRLMRQEIKDEYIRQYLLGRGGLEQMTQVDWGSIGGMLKEQYGWLDKFVAEIETGRLSEGGPGSGHHGHKGIPGKRGGSAPGAKGGGGETYGYTQATAADKKWVASLTGAERGAIAGYMNAGAPWMSSSSINGKLRSGDQLTKEERAYVKALDSAIAKAPKASKNTTLYRSLPSGAKISDGGYVSAMRTRRGLGTAYAGRGAEVREFTIPKGTPVASVSALFFPDIGEEVLLPRGVVIEERYAND